MASNMVVRTNILSINAHRNLTLVGNQQARASQRLSSGFRINSAADDAAGLAISETMRAQIRSIDQASRNASDGVSMVQVAEGALNTVTDMLIRIRELTVQAANDTYTLSDRAKLFTEIELLMDEIFATMGRVEFNTMALLHGGHDVPHDFVEYGGNTGFYRDNEHMQGGGNEGVQGRPGTSTANNNGRWEGPAVPVPVRVHLQIGPNSGNGESIDWHERFLAPLWDGLNQFESSFVTGGTLIDGTTTSAGWVDMLDPEHTDQPFSGYNLEATLPLVDEILATAATARAEMGAWMNRLEYTIQNLDLTSENLSAAESRIRDADMAREMMRFTQASVLQQAATAMLAQANQAPNAILQLLQ